MTWGPTDRSQLTPVAGGLATVAGFSFGATAAGLKQSGALDLALVVADQPAAVAAVTTTNRVVAAPVLVSREAVANGTLQAVVINAGNANACTGERGMADARRMAAETAAAVGAVAGDVAVLSTGIIGVPMPMDLVSTGIVAANAARGRSVADADGVARAMLTTDTRTKIVAFEVSDGQGSCTIAGVAKGSGMIEPNMATMLAVILTDAPIQGALLRPLLADISGRTFNRICVDGCGSTNDTVVALASGSAAQPPGAAAFATALEAVCADLARMIVEDGEGTTRIAEVTVTGADTAEDATHLVQAIARSPLFRTALHGADPNWGRILQAMGDSPGVFDPDRVDVRIGNVDVCRFGMATAFDAGTASAAMSKDHVPILVTVGQGPGTDTMLVSDLSREYITINADYHT
ncbi:MAG: bifunctional glutamate N-acetyltransferase/amino-acid acetyltransferase ArgJ [Nitriliruptorales bacterium]|nr:bifunctional glutamate N-acetyltransferase/amino-acid acetyltransferase ArgJ [Nitriliruptorales bacterium]